MKKPFLLFCFSWSLFGAAGPGTFTDAANGNWNSGAVWTCVPISPATSCSNTVPADSDVVTLSGGHTITFTGSIGGILSGLAYPGVTITNGSALQSDGLGAYQILLGSTGTTCGSNIAGITINGGTFTTASNSSVSALTTITSPGGTYPVFINHSSYGKVSSAVLDWVYFINLGTGSGANCAGIADTSGGDGDFSVTFSHMEVNGGWGQFAGNNFVPSGSNITAIGVTGNMMGLVGNNPGGAWTVTNLTNWKPAANYGTIQLSNYTPDNLTLTAAVVYNTSANSEQLLTATNSSATSAAFTISYPLVYFDPAQSASSNSIALNVATSSNAHGATIQYGMVRNAYNALQTYVSSPLLSVTGMWSASNYNTGVGQGQFFMPRGNISVSGSMFTFDDSAPSNTNAGIALLCYGASGGPGATLSASRNTVFFPAPHASINATAYAVGDGGTNNCITPLLTNNLSVSGNTGVSDAGTQTWSTAGTGGVGASNNNVYGATTPYYSAGTSTNFGSSHPNVSYGDFNPPVNPGLIAPGRRIAQFDAQLGGPGTDEHFFDMMAARDGITATTGNAGGLSYDARYTPQALYAWLNAGFAPTNIAMGTGATDGSYIGAVKPVLIGAWQ